MNLQPDHPYGNDLDDLLKRFLDTLNATVFSDVPGKDGCVESLEATKVRVHIDADAGAEFEIVMLSGA